MYNYDYLGELLECLEIDKKDCVLSQDLKQAFTHSTFANEKREFNSYELHEFLGDSIIQFLVSKYVFENYKYLDEGKATTLRATIVKTETLKKFSTDLDLFKYLQASKGATNLYKSKKVHADLFESFVAAVYITYGIEKVEKILFKTLYPEIDKMVNKENKDSKTLFQELVQANNISVEYETSKHMEGFVSIVSFNGTKYGTGFGNNKKEAEENAAKAALDSMQV
ncbi:ribonuclease III [Mycoplasma phocoenae]|uniref:Ribonuclease 3 n=1 Tax=Mycoplasma phocoenae TaxID=754517 RepID=A0A858U446_9MOLU|nr:ribonuclease III [Mycoplasma phocoenae]QJG67240.1 ribonuclease III [Mycoplasma phocoenae]